MSTDIHDVHVPLHERTGEIGVDTVMHVTVSESGMVLCSFYQHGNNGAKDHVLLFSDDIDEVISRLQEARRIAEEKKARDNA